MSTMRSREAKNCLITHFMPIKPCKAILTNKNHLTRTRLTSQNWPKWKNRKKPNITKKNRKNRKKPVPNLKFAVAFGFFGLQPPLDLTISEFLLDFLLRKQISNCYYLRVPPNYQKILFVQIPTNYRDRIYLLFPTIF